MLKIFAKRNKKSQSGATAIEAAFVLPIFIALIFVIMESCLVFYYQVAIDGALQQAVREVKVSSNPASYNAEIRNNVIEGVPGLMNPQSLFVTTAMPDYTSGELAKQIVGDVCIGDGTEAPQPCSACIVKGKKWIEKNGVDGCQDQSTATVSLGNPGDILRIIAVYRYEPITPFLAQFFGTSTYYTVYENPNNPSSHVPGALDAPSKYYSGTQDSRFDSEVNENVLKANGDGVVLITAGVISRNELN